MFAEKFDGVTAELKYFDLGVSMLSIITLTLAVLASLDSAIDSRLGILPCTSKQGWIPIFFILLLADSTSLDAFDSKLENENEHLLEIDGRLRNPLSQTWIGIVILELPDDARLELALSIK